MLHVGIHVGAFVITLSFIHQQKWTCYTLYVVKGPIRHKTFRHEHGQIIRESVKETNEKSSQWDIQQSLHISQRTVEIITHFMEEHKLEKDQIRIAIEEDQKALREVQSFVLLRAELVRANLGYKIVQTAAVRKAFTGDSMASEDKMYQSLVKQLPPLNLMRTLHTRTIHKSTIRDTVQSYATALMSKK